MIQYSFITESLNPLSITQDKESYIGDNIVYHGSQNGNMKLIKGSRTHDRRLGYNCVFVTPFKWSAAHFIFDSKILYNEIIKEYPELKKIKLDKFIWGFKTNGMRQKLREKVHNPEFKKKMQTTYPQKSIVDIFMFDTNKKQILFKYFVRTFTGYIYYIDYNKYKDKAFQDNDIPWEFVIRDNVKPFKVDKISVKFLIKCTEWKKDK